ncbi:hypothetical protein NDI56_16790 [Haloarcula sp. S1CR25-12]|uniref:CR-type domain-containing protein n=1 Tax=Haloarcula saliterrae TaxID=2950534 RepID=A0ABU2FFL9_9EURY|nr:hypothetical protein [Haloarcula sp. S1CR25-12]MDS0261057.1 hypothetical protein [Haloarcula sp. S1CR25-12]
MTKSTAQDRGTAGDDPNQAQSARAAVREFGDSWKRPNDFTDRATVSDVTPERCEKHIVKEITAVENRETIRTPPSEYDAAVNNRTSFEDRYDLARSEFPDTTVEYVCKPDSVDTCHECSGAGETRCSTCSNGKVSCGTCNGNGMESCSNCSGYTSTGPKGQIGCPDCGASGTRGHGDEKRTCATCNGDRHVMCNSCSGSGEHRCTNCGGGGTVTCGTCGGTTIVVCGVCQGECELVTADVGSVEFETETSEKGLSDIGVPEKYITRERGTKFKTEETWNDVAELDTETVVRTQTERRHVDATRIDYSYGDEEWELYDVEGSVRAQSYPKSGARNLVPWVIGGALLLLLGVGVYQFLL